MSRRGINTADSDGKLPLHEAVRNEQSVEKIKLLLSFGANPATEDDYGKTAFHYAHFSSVKIVELLLQYCDEKDIIDLPDLYDYTLLHRAVEADNVLLVKFLIKNEAVDVNAFNCNWETPLDLATNREIIAMLTKAGGL